MARWPTARTAAECFCFRLMSSAQPRALCHSTTIMGNDAFVVRVCAPVVLSMSQVPCKLSARRSICRSDKISVAHPGYGCTCLTMLRYNCSPTACIRTRCH